MKLSQVLKVLNLCKDEQATGQIYLEIADKEIDGIFTADVAINSKWAHKIDVVKINLNQNYQYDILADLTGFIKANRGAVNREIKRQYTTEHLKSKVQFYNGDECTMLEWLTNDEKYPDKDGEKFYKIMQEVITEMLETKKLKQGGTKK